MNNENSHLMPGGPPPEAPSEARTVESVTLEILTLQRQANVVNILYAIEIGRRLTEVKAMLPHGQWGAYLKDRTPYSQSNANNLMRVFREYGADQQSLFGSAKSQTFANLPYSKALRLLAIPDEEEREQFAAEHDLDAMSVRELDAAIKARDAAQEEAEELRKEAARLQEAQEKASALARRLQAALSDANANVQATEAEQERLLRELEDLRNRPVDVAVQVDQESVEAARQAAIAEMTEKVDKAKASQEKADKKRKAAEESLAAAQKSLAATEEELSALKARASAPRELTAEEKEALTAAEVEKARAADAERLRDLEKQLAQADPDIAAFKAQFDTWQEGCNKLQGDIERIAQTNADKAFRLRQALRTALEQQLSQI